MHRTLARIVRAIFVSDAGHEFSTGVRLLQRRLTSSWNPQAV
jgi:hypothetical protein